MNRFIIDEDDISISFPQEVETLNGGPGSGNYNPGQGRGIGKPSKSSILSNKMKSLSWNETQDLLRDKETRQIIKEIGLKTYDDLWNMWAKVKIEDFTEKDVKEIDIDDAFDVVRKNIRLSALEGWFVNADSNYKAEIVTKILENKELRNAGLNIAYYNYKNRFESDISFSDFIKTPISLYRGEHGQTHVTQDWFDAYTPAKDVAEGFGDIITEIKIKPIETLGAYFDNAESEYLVLTKTSMHNMNSMKDENLFITRINKLDKILNSINENLDYRYDVKAYKEYLKEWLKHKDEPEYLNGGVLSFAEFWEHDIDYEFEDYKKILELIDEYNKKKELVINGGPGSGNFNPGQGRGVGKPASGHTPHGDAQYSAKNYLSKKEYENIVNYSSEDNFTEEELDAIAGYTKSMGYGASCDLNQAIRENDFGEIIERENVVYPEDDSQIVTWKENKEFIEQKIKDKKKYDSLNQEIQLAASVLRKGGLSDKKETEKLKAYVSDMQKERDNLSKTLKYSEYENYIKNYEKGLYKDIKDDQKMWTIDEDKLSKISVVKLREKQKSEQKRFDEVLEIPRLMWSMYYDDKPTTIDTLANKYQRDFKDLDKLDNIIKNKGFVLDKDITVTRRVANAKVIENQIKNKGEYTQNGITSVTAAKSIGKKMPSGVHMGNDLLRITIPAGTRVISTYNPFVRDTQKSADKYNGGKLSEEDNRNLRMIKGQNELILPSGSKFVSPNGNSISKNEDGSYQLILKTEEGKMSNNRIERLNFLQEIFNGVNKGNPYHDEKGRFTSKNGKNLTGSSSFVADDKEIDEYCDDIVELSKCLIRNKVKGSKTKVLGKNLEGRRVDILNSDHVLKSFEDGHEDDKRVEEIKQQIENKKKAGAVVVVIRKTKDGRNVGEIVDGNHTFSAFRKLKDEGKYYYVPVVLTTPKLVDKWEKSFKSIDDMLNHEKTLLPVREFSREKTER